MKYKEGQIKLSFGTIFSIILAAVFIAFAIYGVTQFLGVASDAQLEKFKSDLQSDLDEAWQSTGDFQDEIFYSAPRGIKKVCFDELESGLYLQLRSEDKVESSFEIEHGVVEEDFCINVFSGDIKILLSKDYGDNFVTISDLE